MEEFIFRSMIYYNPELDFQPFSEILDLDSDPVKSEIVTPLTETTFELKIRPGRGPGQVMMMIGIWSAKSNGSAMAMQQY